MDVYQRTPNWIIPRNERRFTRVEKALFRHVPGAQRAGGPRSTRSSRSGRRRSPGSRACSRSSRTTARRTSPGAIDDPELIAKVTPTYRAGCKRILISNAWYPALAADNVDLVTDPITKITGDAIVTADPSTGSGTTERPIDVLVVATGFYVTEPPIAQHVTGRDGRTLAEVWDEAGMAAYKGTTINGFPNLFQIVGPNTALGHSSMIFMIESQVRYIVDAARTMRREGLGAVEPSVAAQDEWTATMRERMKPTVWTTGGCASWYLDKFGNNTTLWPGQTFTFRGHLSRFDVDQLRRRPDSAHRCQHCRGGTRMKSLKDKVVVITGAGSGIGRALALNLAEKGSLCSRCPTSTRRAWPRPSSSPRRRAPQRPQRPARRRRPRGVRGVRRPAWSGEFGRVNVVVNNAGVALAGDFVDLEMKDIDWIMGINFWGVVHGSKFFLPHLIESGDGHLVNISSLFGLVSMPGQSMYNASKYAVRGMTEAIREEMLISGHKVGVTAVHPGGIKTAIARNARVSDHEDKAATAKLFDEKLARMTPEKAAAIIVKGIQRNQARVLVGIDAHLIHTFGKLAGSRYQDAIAMGSKRVLPKKVKVV